LISDASNNLTGFGNVTIGGNLTVNGTTTTVDTATLTVEDPLIKLASGNDSADSVDVGFYGLYDVGGTDKYAGIVRDASDGKFLAFKDLQLEPTTTVDKTATGYTKATLVADIEGDVTGSSGTTTTAAVATAIDAVANNTTDETVYPTFVDGATGTQGIETDTGFTYNPNSGLLTVAGEVDAGSLDISGNADIDGTLEADAFTVDGTTLEEYISDTVGTMVTGNAESGITVAYQDSDNTLDFTVGTLNQDTTGTADLITASANNTADETVYPTFVDGATGSQGLETDTGLMYNPLTGTLTSTIFVGALTGNASTATTVANDAISLAKMAGGTDGNLISYDASGDPVAVATGNSGQVLTSAGIGAPPTFTTISSGFVATATADLTFGGDWDIIDLQRLSLETQDDSWDTDSDNAAIANETQLYAREIDSNNDGIFARIKKNGSIVYLQIA